MTRINNRLWHNYGATQFANSIATIQPKITFNNKDIQNQWDKFIQNNNLLSIHYKLVYESSINNIYALGIKILNNEPVLVVGRPIDYKKVGNKLLGLKISLDMFTKNDICYEIDIYDIENHKYIIKKGLCLKDNLKAKITEMPFSPFETEKNLFDVIPFELFFANPLEKNDFYNLDQKWIDDYLEHLKLLLTDSFISKGIIHLNKPNINSNANNYNKLKESLINSEAIIFENENLFSLLQEGGLQIQQANSNTISIIEKLRFYESKIKQFAFLKKETSDLGTKNLQSAETNLLNQDSDDYIEIKANLFEIQWEQFIRNVFFNYLKNYKNINVNSDEIEINVEIAGSTNFLKNKQNQYIQTQQGNLINPNDNSNNTKDFNLEKEKDDE